MANESVNKIMDIDETLVALIRHRLKYIEEGDHIDCDHQLKPLGLDSMEAIDLLLDIEDSFNIIIPEQYLNEETFATIRTLSTAVAKIRDDQTSG